MKVDELKKLGFEYIGFWFEKKNGIDFRLTKFAQNRCVYAFVVVDEVVYVGVCESFNTTLKQRMMRIVKARGPEGSTSVRLREKIAECLRKGIKVLIYALSPRFRVEYAGVEVDILLGLEHSIIHRHKPLWNRKI